MSFSPSEFLESDISLSAINALFRDDLIALAKHLTLEFESRARRAVIKKRIVCQLVDMDKLPSSAKDALKASASVNYFELEKQKLRLQRRELELRYQAKHEERKLKLRDLELELESMRLQLDHSRGEPGDTFPHIMNTVNTNPDNKYVNKSDSVSKPWSWVKCNYCHCKGHFMSACWDLKDKQLGNKPVAFAETSSRSFVTDVGTSLDSCCMENVLVSGCSHSDGCKGDISLLCSPDHGCRAVVVDNNPCSRSDGCKGDVSVLCSPDHGW